MGFRWSEGGLNGEATYQRERWRIVLGVLVHPAIMHLHLVVPSVEWEPNQTHSILPFGLDVLLCKCGSS